MPFTPRDSQISEELITNDITDSGDLLPSRTWEFDFDSGEFTGRRIDNIDAYGQAMEKALLTERDMYPIYSDSYGSELHLLISDSVGSSAYKESEAVDMAQEAIAYDDRTQTINSITAESKEDQLHVSISVVPDERVSIDSINVGVNLNG